MNKSKILFFGFFNPDYARNRVLMKGLERNGVKVSQCRVRNGRFRMVRLFCQYWMIKKDFDWLLVAFPGQEAIFLARMLTRRPIIFDAFTSHYGGYILDRRYFRPNSGRAKYYRWLDKWSCRLADLVLLDTQAHIDFFIREYDLPAEKFRRIFVGADTDVFQPSVSRPANGKFLVHFHGSYVPLQGVEHIIRAAKLLEQEDIQFNLIGRGQTYPADCQLAQTLAISNINFIDNVAYEKLADYMNQADICLGIFGASPKTALVIPNKVYEALVMAKPVITADTPAARELLIDRENVLFCRQADAEDLANKIIELKNDPILRQTIAAAGGWLFKNRLGETTLGSELLVIANQLTEKS